VIGIHLLKSSILVRSQASLCPTEMPWLDGFDIRPDFFATASAAASCREMNIKVYSLSGEVQGMETIQVRDRTFDTLKVVLQIETRENGVLLAQATDTSWYAPVAKLKLTMIARADCASSLPCHYVK
jgi:hypothetical protein